MSAEKQEGDGPAIDRLRMDQEFQLRNLRRLAMEPGFESSTGQYAGPYTSGATRDQKDVSLRPADEEVNKSCNGT